MEVRLNVLAKNLKNAKEIVEVTEGKVFIGILTKEFNSTEEAIKKVFEFQNAGIPVSIGLGAGDPQQWQKVVEVAIATKPAHVNQVFTAAGYTLGALKAVKSEHTIVNALIRPSGIPGKVFISTGPTSEKYLEMVSCDLAVAMLAEIGVPSVKFFPIEGNKRLAEVEEMVKACINHSITIFEPTGGIDKKSLPSVLEVCLKNGIQTVIPHVYTSIIDKTTGLTRIEDVEELTTIIKRVVE
ncbi:KDGP aldolase [Thermoanaerobacter thermohydrosulfuricus]|nr:oxo-acid lyase [Clostridia bacterium]